MTQRVSNGDLEGGLSSLHAPSTVAHVVGARPNFMKAAPVMAALAAADVPQRLIHTGQHYSDAMSDVFFRELGLPSPDVNLNVGSGSHGVQTAALLVALEAELLEHRPALLVVYGDVNSTLAAAIVAAKQEIPLAHVEAGLRSFDRSMPEEVNRVVADALSDLLFVTSPEATDNLRREGIARNKIHFVGNPMIDTLLKNLDRFDADAARATHGLDGPHIVATIHRPANTDEPAVVERIVAMLRAVAGMATVVLPLHPRGREAFSRAGLDDVPNLRVLDPLGYIDFLSLVRGASCVITDSGGVQEETTMLGVPCLTIRPNTERPITISHGTNRLMELQRVPATVRQILSGTIRMEQDRPPLWDGAAGPRIAAVITSFLRPPARRR